MMDKKSNELCGRLAELDPKRPTVVSCAARVRGHVAAWILKRSGFSKARNLAGGRRFAIVCSRVCAEDLRDGDSARRFAAGLCHAGNAEARRRLDEGQAQAFLEYAGEQDLRCQTIMRDWDGKYTCDFTSVFTDRSITVKPVGPRAPNLNTSVERWTQSLKHEALNHFVVFGMAHFGHIVREFVDCYHECPAAPRGWQPADSRQGRGIDNHER